MDAAARAILAQADEIMVKPTDITPLVAMIKNRMALGPAPSREMVSVATMVERSAGKMIADWSSRIQSEDGIMAIPMSTDARAAHLPQLFRDLVDRLRSSKALGTREMVSPAAGAHGMARRKQGYSAAMMVEESRQLQVSVFHGLQENHASLDFSVV